MQIMRNAFFKPYVGSLYDNGIKDKKILVLGASFYCDRTDCEFFHKCTDRRRKDSSAYDLKCPAYAGTGTALHEEPESCVADRPRAYRLFSDNMAYALGITSDELWDRVAFTNYVQFFLPASAGYAETLTSDLSQRDFEAFIEVAQELKPDIVIVWGCVVNSPLKENNPFLVSRTELDETDYYVCHLNIPGLDHDITVVNPYHPSSSTWFSEREKFDKYLLIALNS